MLAGDEPDAERAAAEAEDLGPAHRGVENGEQRLLQGLEDVRETHARLLNSHVDYKGERVRPHKTREARGPKMTAGFCRGRCVRDSGADYRPTSFISMPTSVLVRRRSQPDFWSPSAIGPKDVRTSLSTGKPASASIRRTMCLRPSWRVTSTR